MLHNELIFLVLTYLDLFTLIENRSLNVFFTSKYYALAHKNTVQNDYKINSKKINLSKALKNIHLSYLKKCIICGKDTTCDTILLLHNILPSSGKCFHCFNYNCDCVLYLYGHDKCLSNFELKRIKNSKIRNFLIPKISEHSISGLLLR